MRPALQKIYPGPSVGRRVKEEERASQARHLGYVPNIVGTAEPIPGTRLPVIGPILFPPIIHPGWSDGLKA